MNITKGCIISIVNPDHGRHDYIVLSVEKQNIKLLQTQSAYWDSGKIKSRFGFLDSNTGKIISKMGYMIESLGASDGKESVIDLKIIYKIEDLNQIIDKDYKTIYKSRSIPTINGDLLNRIENEISLLSNSGNIQSIDGFSTPSIIFEEYEYSIDILGRIRRMN